MGTVLGSAQSIGAATYSFEFSICTLVTKKEEYLEMLASFEQAGFNTAICEFLYLDNTLKNNFDGYSGLNLFLKQAKGKYIIICHQDILTTKDGINELRNCLSELDQTDPNWAICGNAGAAGPNHVVYHISYPGDKHLSKGNFPLKVSALDENFILIKNGTHLSFSSDLAGFHLYATDLCLHAELNGYSAYVIRFDLIHKSTGNLSPDFFALRKQLIKKYSRFFRSRWIQTNCTVFFLSNSLLERWLFGNPLALFLVRMKNSIKKKMRS